MRKKTQYYKVVNTKSGHNGVFYHVGLNEDPNPVPLKDIGTCESGAIYFTNEENLIHFYAYGDSIAWITPVSKVKKDEGYGGGMKWKAHKINITKLLPFKQALPLLKGISPKDYDTFGVKFTLKQILENKDWSLMEKAQILRKQQSRESLLKFIASHKNNKKFLKEVYNEFSIRNNAETNFLIKEEIFELITIGDLRNFLYTMSKKKSDALIKKLVKKHPNVFAEILMKMRS